MRLHKNPTVLVAEDQCLIRSAIGDCLKEEGFDVIFAPDGLQAEQILAAGQDVQLLFSDIRMPEMDGLSLARRTRDHSPNVGILLTSYDEPANLPQGVTFLQKPYDVTQLADRLRQMLTASRQA
jgi:CheY-like chemotaxis protein